MVIKSFSIFQSLIVTILIPILIVTSVASFVINLPLLYSYGFERYEISDYTSIDPSELKSVGKQIRDYFNNDDEWITIQVTRNNIFFPNLFNNKEILHMKDVKQLINLVYFSQKISVVLIILATFYCVFFETNNRLKKLLYAVSRGGILTLIIFGSLAIASVVGFDKLFIYFHQISFNNDLWILDPRTDYLIAMFPQGFFFDTTMLIGFLIIFFAILCCIIPRMIARNFQ
tara:strand:- start:801 stop:1490 length:690 start_codon:yes stop_codon:yes gene_type:complete